MSKDPDTQRFLECGRKTMYVTYDEAWDAAQRANQKPDIKRQGVELEPYDTPCRWCGGWHLRKKKGWFWRK